MLTLPLNPLRYPYYTLRPWLAHPVFWTIFFLSPVLGWFRVDMLAQQIVFFSQHYPFEAQFVFWLPVGFYLGVIAIALITTFWGRLFCGWSCPHNILTEWTRPLRALVGREPMPRGLKRLFRKRPWLRPLLTLASLPAALGLTFLLAGLLIAYVMPPDWLVTSYSSGTPHIALVFGHGLLTLIGLFLLYSGHDFCRTCCPYGMAQSLPTQSGRWRPMEIAFTGNQATQCKTCSACETACPVAIDPRDPNNLRVGQFDGCFNCGVCIDACSYVRSVQPEPGGLLAFRPARRLPSP